MPARPHTSRHRAAHITAGLKRDEALDRAFDLLKETSAWPAMTAAQERTAREIYKRHGASRARRHKRAMKDYVQTRFDITPGDAGTNDILVTSVVTGPTASAVDVRRIAVGSLGGPRLLNALGKRGEPLAAPPFGIIKALEHEPVAGLPLEGA